MKKFTPYFTATLRGQMLEWDDPEMVKAHLNRIKNLKSPETSLKITITRFKDVRSLSQNNYYRGVVIPILADYFGYDQFEHDEVHAELKRKFLGFGGDDRFMITKSTTKLSTKEFSDFVNQVRSWALQEFNLFIPEPNEVAYSDEIYTGY